MTLKVNGAIILVLWRSMWGLLSRVTRLSRPINCKVGEIRLKGRVLPGIWHISSAGQSGK